MESLLVGIDIGTSACKVSAFTPSGYEVASATESYDLFTPAAGQVEQDATAWWSATKLALSTVTAAIGKLKIVGIGLSGQSWSAVPIGADGQVLANTPIWMDTRAESICEELRSQIDLQQVLELSGNPLAASYSTGKILWFAQERPDVFSKTKWFLQSNSYIGLCLTGVVSQDLCQAYGYHFFDQARGVFDVDLAATMGIDSARIPEPVPCDHIIGTVLPEVAAETGLSEGIPVVAGGLDAACAALGVGVIDQGQTQDQGGQAGGMSIVTDHPLWDRRLILSRHVVPGRWLLQGGTAAGGAALRWARSALTDDAMDYQTIDQIAGQVPAGANGVWFLPYLAGERSPHWDPTAQGTFFGLSLATTRADLLRSVMEGVAYSVLDNIRVAQAAGADLGQVRTVGGAAESELWTQIKADVYDTSIEVPEVSSASALGAAMLAGVATGVYRDYHDAVQRAVRVIRRQEPGEGTSVYVARFPVFQQLYTNLKSTMHMAAAVEQHPASSGVRKGNPNGN